MTSDAVVGRVVGGAAAADELKVVCEDLSSSSPFPRDVLAAVVAVDMAVEVGAVAVVAVAVAVVVAVAAVAVAVAPWTSRRSKT
jgi:hypothetical protein